LLTEPVTTTSQKMVTSPGTTLRVLDLAVIAA
jgi:hypothetical protein